MGAGASFFGRRKAAIYRCLLAATNAGPFDGGCLLLALAMQRRYGGQVMVLVRRDGQADHAVLKLGDRFIDGDGAADFLEIIRRFNANERADVVGVRPWRTGDLPESPAPTTEVEHLARLLPPCPPA